MAISSLYSYLSTAAILLILVGCQETNISKEKLTELPQFTVNISPRSPNPLALSEHATSLSKEDKLALKWDDKKSSALAVMHNGNLILEQYTPDRFPNTVSRQDAIAAPLIGVLIARAMMDNYLDNVFQNIAEFYPGFGDTSQKSKELEIRHLLGMSASYSASEETRKQWVSEENFAKEWQNILITNHPGSLFEYDAMSTMLGIRVLEHTVPTSFPEYVSTSLWETIEAEHPHYWQTTPNGSILGYRGLYLTPRDALRIGQLFVNGGAWKNKEIIPKPFVDISSSMQQEHGSYGYCFYHLQQDNTFLLHTDTTEGQYMVVIPDKNVVAVWCSQEENLSFSDWTHWLIQRIK